MGGSAFGGGGSCPPAYVSATEHDVYDGQSYSSFGKPTGNSYLHHASAPPTFVFESCNVSEQAVENSQRFESCLLPVAQSSVTTAQNDPRIDQMSHAESQDKKRKRKDNHKKSMSSLQMISPRAIQIQ